MRNYPVQILNITNATSQTSAAEWVGQSVAASFVVTNGDTSAAGTVKIQGSNDLPVGAQAAFTPTNWADIPSATSTIVSGVGPAIVLQTMNFQYIRVVFTSSNAGSTKITVNASFLAV